MSSFKPGLKFGELDELLIPHDLERVRLLCHDALTKISILFLNTAIKISKARYPLGGQSGPTPSLSLEGLRSTAKVPTCWRVTYR